MRIALRPRPVLELHLFLDDPEHGDQFQQSDHRVRRRRQGVLPAAVSLAGRGAELNRSFGCGTDDMTNVGSRVHTERRQRLSTTREDACPDQRRAATAERDAVVAVVAHECRRAPRRLSVRLSSRSARRTAAAPARGAGQPEGVADSRAVAATELYVQRRPTGFTNDARGTTIDRDPGDRRAGQRVTPLARASGAEAGARFVARRGPAEDVTVWRLDLDGELMFVGDAGTTEASATQPSLGRGVETLAAPRPWLMLDADLAWSRAHFTDADPVGDRIPGSIVSVVSAGVTVDGGPEVFASLRLATSAPASAGRGRNSIRSRRRQLVNWEDWLQVLGPVRLGLDVFNLLNAAGATWTTTTGRACAASPRRGRRPPPASCAAAHIARVRALALLRRARVHW